MARRIAQTFTAFLELVASAVRSFDPSGGGRAGLAAAEATFVRQKELLRREIGAFDAQQAYQFAKYFEASVAEVPHFSRKELITALDDLTLSKVGGLAAGMRFFLFKGQI